MGGMLEYNNPAFSLGNFLPSPSVKCLWKEFMLWLGYWQSISSLKVLSNSSTDHI